MNTKPSVARQIVMALVFLGAVALIAFLGSRATIANTDGWYAEVTKVPWDPPNAVFSPVWTVLYILIALAGWLLWRRGYAPSGPNGARRPLTIYVVQLVLNGLWTPVFFAGYPVIGEPAWWVALAIIVLLIASVVWLGVAASRFSKTAAWIMVPYLLWLLFASTLNAGIIVLN